MEKQLTSSGCPEQAATSSLFIILTKPGPVSRLLTRPRPAHHCPVTTPEPGSDSGVAALIVCCLLFIHQLVMEILSR